MIDHYHLQEILWVEPESKPWRKACAECAFRRANPQRLTDDDFEWMFIQRDMGGFAFYCEHRAENGWHRECASWAAIEAGRAALATRAQDGAP